MCAPLAPPTSNVAYSVSCFWGSVKDDGNGLGAPYLPRLQAIRSHRRERVLRFLQDLLDPAQRFSRFPLHATAEKQSVENDEPGPAKAVLHIPFEGRRFSVRMQALLQTKRRRGCSIATRMRLFKRAATHAPTNPRTLASGGADFHAVSTRGRLIRFPRTPIGEAQRSVSGADGLEGEQLNFGAAGYCAARRLGVLSAQSKERRCGCEGPRIAGARLGMLADNQHIVCTYLHVLAILRFCHDNPARTAGHVFRG